MRTGDSSKNINKRIFGHDRVKLQKGKNYLKFKDNDYDIMQNRKFIGAQKIAGTYLKYRDQQSDIYRNREQFLSKRYNSARYNDYRDRYNEPNRSKFANQLSDNGWERSLAFVEKYNIPFPKAKIGSSQFFDWLKHYNTNDKQKQSINIQLQNKRSSLRRDLFSIAKEYKPKTFTPYKTYVKPVIKQRKLLRPQLPNYKPIVHTKNPYLIKRLNKPPTLKKNPYLIKRLNK